MATVKTGGSTKNGRDSQPKYLGIKLNHGELATPGAVLVRQRGTNFIKGKNVKMGKDHTLYSVVQGKVEYKTVRRVSFDGQKTKKNQVNVK